MILKKNNNCKTITETAVFFVVSFSAEIYAKAKDLNSKAKVSPKLCLIINGHSAYTKNKVKDITVGWFSNVKNCKASYEPK